MATYTVQKGESLASIAGKIYGDQRMFAVLSQANGGAWDLKPGDVLELPEKVGTPFVPNVVAAKAGMATSQQAAAGATTANFTPEMQQANKDAYQAFASGASPTLDINIPGSLAGVPSTATVPTAGSKLAPAAGGTPNAAFGQLGVGRTRPTNFDRRNAQTVISPSAASYIKPAKGNKLQGYTPIGDAFDTVRKVPEAAVNIVNKVLQGYAPLGRGDKVSRYAPIGNAIDTFSPNNNTRKAPEAARGTTQPATTQKTNSDPATWARDANGNIIPPRTNAEANAQGRPVAQGTYSNMNNVNGVAAYITMGAFPAGFTGITSADATKFMSDMLIAQGYERPSQLEINDTLTQMGLVRDKSGGAWVWPNGVNEKGELLGNVFPDLDVTPRPTAGSTLQLKLPSRNWLDYMPPLPDMEPYTNYGGNNGGNTGWNNGGGAVSRETQNSQLWIAMSMRAAGG